MPTLGGRWPGLGAAGGSARAASSPLGAAYLPRGRQGPVHVEEAERRAARSHDLKFHAAPNRTRWHLELGTELPGSAPVPQSTPGGEESTPTMLKTSFSCSLSGLQIPDCNASYAGLLRPSMRPQRSRGQVGFASGSRQPGHGKKVGGGN